MGLYLTKPFNDLHCNSIFFVIDAAVVAFINDAVAIVVDTFKDYIHVVAKDILLKLIMDIIMVDILMVARIHVTEDVLVEHVQADHILVDHILAVADHILAKADHILAIADHILANHILAKADHNLVSPYLVKHILAAADHILVNQILTKAEHILVKADHSLVIIKDFLIKDNQLHLHFKCFIVNFLLFQDLLTMLVVELTFMLFTIQIVLAFLKVIKITFLLFIKLQIVFMHFLMPTFKQMHVVVIAILEFVIIVF
jgi:hypothetical protein